ncbi:MAG: presqualene diphosphate synthase HpnD [Pseudorhodoplanes sp.]
MAETKRKTASSPDAADGADIAERVRASGTSFFWAMRFLPREKRAAIYAVYAFCREVDDIADGMLSRENKCAELAKWRLEIDRLYAGTPRHPVTLALLSALPAFGLEKSAFLAVIDGMEMDARGPIRAPDWATLELYCSRVAGAVGLLCVRIFGLAGEPGRSLADSLGLALQLTNILRDLAEDASDGRLYLPAEALATAGIGARDPASVLADPRLPDAARIVAARAAEAYRTAEEIMRAADATVVRPARIMMGVYRAHLTRMEREQFARVALPRAQGGLKGLIGKAEKFVLALRYVWA